MANCFRVLKGIATIVLWCDDAPSADELSSACYLVTGAAPATGQSLDAALFQQVAQVTGRGGFGYLGYGLVLGGADTVLETALAAIEQAVKYFDLLR